MLPTNKQQQLKNHKRLATGLLLAMTFVYIICVILQAKYPWGWIDYVKAFSEAAMVGALADWFAVTALFSYPLGIKIPHTNIIENSKNTIGENLGLFVVDNFLTPEVLKPYINKINATEFISHWLDQPKDRSAIAQQIAEIADDALQNLDDNLVPQFIAGQAAELIKQVKANELIANTLQYLIQQKDHVPIITQLAQKAMQLIEENRNMVYDKVHQESYVFVPRFVNNKLANKITDGLIKYFHEIAENVDHPIRKDLDLYLAQLIEQLHTNENWKSEINNTIISFFNEASLQQYANAIWINIKVNLIKMMQSDNSPIKGYIEKMIANLNQQLKSDKELQTKLNGWLQKTAYKYILRNNKIVGKLISDTIEKWDGKALSEKLELEVGKDLQYIRINGTLVGGMVGLIIYSLTKLIQSLNF